MSSERCLVVLVLSAVIYGVRLSDSTESSIATTAPAEPDYPIDKFFNTSVEIWVFNTTQPKAQKCRKDVNKNITSNTTYFERSYEENGTIIKEELQGKFELHDETRSTVYDRIEVSGGTGGVYEEVLEYSSQNFSCGVVTVLAFNGENTTVWRDLRLRGRPDNATIIDVGCQEKYDYILSVTKKSWTSPYNATCQ
ncbi:uncharacterized protein LOC142587031 [Dermacentor variabilis]|uniref:uncharacterized protein LOC142587031 n=1 Tax=Dermacentor variabilis TaxID=34621 RepID=UPI003F5B721D